MIRASDLPNAAAVWARPVTTAPRNDSRDASWFDGSAADASISGDLNPAARGLSVTQHASLVLAHLRGE